MLDISKINENTLKLFNSVIKLSGSSEDTNIDNIKELYKNYNIVPTKEAVYAHVAIRDFANKNCLTIDNLNSSFYRSNKDVFAKDRFEIFVDQILHYMSTYGTNHTGKAYVPADAINIEIDDTEKLPVYIIDALTEEEIIDKVLNLINSGIALKEDTIDSILVILDELNYEFTNFDDVRNKEVFTKLVEKYGLDNVNNPVEALRYFVYETTDSTLLIKNEQTVEKIKLDAYSKIFKNNKKVYQEFLSYDTNKFAEIFNRFKIIFIAFKTGIGTPEIRKKINAISKASKKMHKPLVENPLGKVTSRLLTNEDKKWIDNATSGAIIRAVNACNLRLSDNQENYLYKIRNGKTFATTKALVSEDVKKILEKNRETLMNVFVERYSKNISGKTVYIPSNVEYGYPVSEKQFLGNIPYGTRLFSKDMISLGVFWDKGYNVTDLDLSLVSLTGQKIGWNSNFRDSDNSIAYSGDMTSIGKNGSVEFMTMYSGDEDQTNIVKASCYCGNTNDHNFDVIVNLNDDAKDFNKNRIVNPENFVFSAKFNATRRESIVGLMYRENGINNVVISPSSAGGRQVSSYSEVGVIATKALVNENKTNITLNKILKECGAIFVNQDEADKADINLDYNNINKDILNLFS